MCIEIFIIDYNTSFGTVLNKFILLNTDFHNDNFVGTQLQVIKLSGWKKSRPSCNGTFTHNMS